MRPIRFATGWTALLLAALATSLSQASFHLWTFSEFYSNADGSVQFIELHSSGSFETVSLGAEIRTTTGNNVFTFTENLSGNTFDKRLLIATPDFASLPGAVTPDYTLPSTSFFDPAGDTIRLFSPSFGEFHGRTFASAPTDGEMSLNYPPAGGASLTNSPTNYAGLSGSVDLSGVVTTGDYNGDTVVDAADYVVWRKTLDQTVDPQGSGADGDQSGTIDAGDYDFWRSHFGEVVPAAASGASTTASVPEPATSVSLLIGLLFLFRFAAPAFQAFAQK